MYLLLFLQAVVLVRLLDVRMVDAAQRLVHAGYIHRC